MAEFHVLFHPFEFRIGFCEGNAILISSKNLPMEAAFFDRHCNDAFESCWSIMGSCASSLIKRKDLVIVVDPGAPQLGGSGAIKARLNQLGLKVKDVNLVINTHLHGDHVGSNFVFRGKPLIIHEGELKSQSLSEIQRAYIEPMEVQEIRGDTKIADDVWIIETPGHTHGSTTVIIGTSEGRVAIAGDTIMAREHFLEKKLPDWESNYKEIFKSMEKIESLKPKKIVPGHDFPFRMTF